MLDAIDDDLTRRARDILRENDKGTYTVPTHGLYPYQWNWDSAFAALGFAELDLDRAWTELETLMTGQWDSGMVPHIIFHRKDDSYFPGPDVWQGQGPIPSSGITQPPVALSVAHRVWAMDPEFGRARIDALYPKLVAWAEWFMTWRTFEGAVFVTHPWESGRDNAPCWDDAMARINPEGVGEYQRRDTQFVNASMRPTKDDYDRYLWLVNRGAALEWDDAKMACDPPFRVADPTMTFILMRGLRDLAVLGRDLGHSVDQVQDWIATLEQGAERLWNDAHGFYDSFNVNTGVWANALTNASFLAWYGGVERSELLVKLDQVLAAAPYGVPSLSPSDDRFDAKRYWRGPSWAIMNRMIGLGLVEAKHPQGRAIKEMTRDVIRKHGFAEYFDPITGEAAGGESFTWTAAVWLFWAGKA